MKFKIGQMVLVDTVLGTVRAARIEAVDTATRRARVLYIDTGERQEDVRLGDIAVAGEDFAAARREQSRDSWRYAALQDNNRESGLVNCMGGSVVRPAPNPDYSGGGGSPSGDRN